MLYIVSTPIGNLQDMTFRAVDVLKSVDLIAAEDTRHTRILLDHYRITTPLTSYFEHNEKQKSQALLKWLKEGKSIALVTDAGTPGISDPGYRIIQLAQQEQIPMTVIPGPCALIAGLTLSGLPSDSFVFVGFLPVKSGGRRKKIEELSRESRTVIFYESPHRIEKVLKDFAEICPRSQVVAAREITKKFEQVMRGTPAEVLSQCTGKSLKGEFVVLVRSCEPSSAPQA